MGGQVQMAQAGHVAQCGAQIVALVGLQKDSAECWLWMCQEHHERATSLFARLPVIGVHALPVIPGQVLAHNGVQLETAAINETWTTFKVAAVPIGTYNVGALKKGDRIQLRTAKLFDLLAHPEFFSVETVPA